MKRSGIIVSVVAAGVLWGVVGFVLAQAAGGGDAIGNIVTKIKTDFNKSVEDANLRYQKAAAPLGAQRAAAIEQARNAAILRLQKAAKEAKQMGSEVGPEIFKNEEAAIRSLAETVLGQGEGHPDGYIFTAIYGVNGTWVDVAAKVKEAVAQRKELVPEKTFEDPAFGQQKALIVFYAKGGKHCVRAIGQAATFSAALLQ